MFCGDFYDIFLFLGGGGGGRGVFLFGFFNPHHILDNQKSKFKKRYFKRAPKTLYDPTSCPRRISVQSIYFSFEVLRHKLGKRDVHETLKSSAESRPIEINGLNQRTDK